MVISRDVNLDESVFGFLSTSLDEDIDELNFNDIDIDLYSALETEYKPTEKRKSRSSENKNLPRKSRAVRQKMVLEEASAPIDSYERWWKNDNPDDKPASLLF